MPCGTYVNMNVRYHSTSFDNVYTVEYEPFDDSGVQNELLEQRIALAVMMIILILLIGLGQMQLVDSFVSYRRGRGFLRKHGHYVHTYGDYNPRYIHARSLYNARNDLRDVGRGSGGRGGFSGGGCACACACACAGGGRAGCSQKDGVRYKKD
jgi:hypothetical protein